MLFIRTDFTSMCEMKKGKIEYTYQTQGEKIMNPRSDSKQIEDFVLVEGPKLMAKCHNNFSEVARALVKEYKHKYSGKIITPPSIWKRMVDAGIVPEDAVYENRWKTVREKKVKKRTHDSTFNVLASFLQLLLHYGIGTTKLSRAGIDLQSFENHIFQVWGSAARETMEKLKSFDVHSNLCCFELLENQVKKIVDDFDPGDPESMKTLSTVRLRMKSHLEKMEQLQDEISPIVQSQYLELQKQMEELKGLL